MTDPVARLNAALEGRYAIERELGEGGMATVFLADDLKHEPVSLSDDIAQLHPDSATVAPMLTAHSVPSAKRRSAT